MFKVLPKLLFTALVFTVLLPAIGAGQSLTGIWRGYFITEGGEQYKYELQVDQTSTNRISGVSYSYLDTRFYGKATLSGNFTKTSKAALIQEIKTVELKMSGGSVACIMKCSFVYSKSGREEFLEGTFSSMYEKTSERMGTVRGASCGGGKVFLRKVPTSDFYVEPFLRNKVVKRDTVTKKPQTNTVQTKPRIKPTTKPPATNKPPVNKPPVTTVTEPRKDSVKRNTTPVVIDKPREIKITIPETTRSRTNELVRTVVVNSEEISVRLYDNGEIDGDTISVYMDGKPIVSNKGLSTAPITLHLKMDETNSEHVLVMVAENLGRIPPNTSLMIVQDGDKRYQVSISSTEQKNAMVRFRYQKN